MDQHLLLTALLFLLHATGAGLALHALCRPHSPQGTIAWMLALLLLPSASIPLYLVLGAARIRRHTTSRHSRGILQRALRDSGAWQPPSTLLSSTIAHCTGYAPCSGNSVKLLQDGNDTYRNLLQAIRRAQRSILIEFFIIRNDIVGNTLRKALEEQARAGVQVYIIYDEIGSHKLPAGYLRALKKAGARIASFNGRRFWLSSILRINYRNHRKLVVIDSELAYLGSLNIGLEYTQAPGRLYWRDTFVSLRGPVVNQCLLSFHDDWHRATGSSLLHLLQPQKQSGQNCCQLIPSGPDDGPMNTWQLTIMELAGSARHRLWLASPYFVPNAAVFHALQAAALRGVDVRVLIPRKGDNRAAQLAMLTFLPGMLAAGVRMLAYEKGFLHEKICVADSATSCLGTANLDERSLGLNYELTLLMEDEQTTAEVAHMLSLDMEQATPFTHADWYKVSVLTRLLANCCRLLSPAL